MAVTISDPERLRARLGDWLRGWLPGRLAAATAQVSDVTISPLAAPRTGQSNETILFDATWCEDGRPRAAGLVLRLQPRANQMFLDADVVREGRLVRELGRLGTVPVPAVHAVEPDAAVLGAPFFLMARVAGRVPAGSPSIHLDPWLRGLTPDQRAELSAHAIGALAAVHQVPLAAVRPIVDPAGTGGTLDADLRTLDRWYRWAARGRAFPVLDRALAEIRGGLGGESGAPGDPGEPVLLWGDPRPGNILFHDDLTVAAVLDWEIASAGPAGLDVGWWLMMDEFARRGAGGEALPGFPTAEGTLEHYRAAGGQPVRDLDFYQLVAAVKLAITLIPAADSLLARGILAPDSRFAHDNVPTQIVAHLLGRPEPDLSPDYRRLSRMDRAARRSRGAPVRPAAADNPAADGARAADNRTADNRTADNGAVNDRSADDRGTDDRAAEGPVSADVRRRNLGRLLRPSTIAVVGLSDRSPLLPLIAPTLASAAAVTFVNPHHASVLGHPTVPSLRDVEGPIDAVMSAMSAERSADLAEAAVGLDIGGLVLVASGFAEFGPDGAARQERVRRAARAGGFAVVGPNGLGYIDVPRRVNLTIASPHRRRPGGISVVSHSGAVLSGIAMAAWQHPGCGLNLLVSAGNEAVTDLADFVDHLADDPGTRAIGLVIETIRRPAEFFAAVRRAIAAGKPVVALTLAHSDRTRRMAAAHTGARAEDAGERARALRAAGVELAADPEELVDRLVLFDQLDRARWTRVEKLAVLTMTGGFASLSFDLAAEEGLEIPALDGFTEWITTNIRGVAVPNPLDMTGLGASLWPRIVARYAASPEVDAMLLVHPLTDEDAEHSAPIVDEFARAAAAVAKPAVVANCSGLPGDWIVEHLGDVLVRGRGLRPSLRGLASLGRFVRYRESLGA